MEGALLQQLLHLPVAQAVVGAILGSQLTNKSGKQEASMVAAAARGAVYGHGWDGSQQQQQLDPHSTIEVTQEVLQVMHASSVSEVIKELREGGRPDLAKRLQKTSKVRNMAAHPDTTLVTDVREFSASSGAEPSLASLQDNLEEKIELLVDKALLKFDLEQMKPQNDQQQQEQMKPQNDDQQQQQQQQQQPKMQQMRFEQLEQTKFYMQQLEQMRLGMHEELSLMTTSQKQLHADMEHMMKPLSDQQKELAKQMELLKTKINELEQTKPQTDTKKKLEQTKSDMKKQLEQVHNEFGHKLHMIQSMVLELDKQMTQDKQQHEHDFQLLELMKTKGLVAPPPPERGRGRP